MATFYNKLRSTRIKTGLWTLIILILLIVSYLWFTNRLQVKSQQELKVLFSEVMGLEVGDKIMYRGMETGRIKSVSLYGDGILVAGKIDAKIRLPLGSVFRIEDSLMGSKSLQILPGRSEQFLNLNQMQIGENPVGLMSLVAAASKSLGKLDDILHDLDSDDGLLQQGEELLGGATEAVKGVSGDFRQVKVEVSEAIRNLDKLTKRVDEFIAENKEELESSIGMAPTAMNKIFSSLDSLDLLSAKLSGSLNALQAGQGTAGKLLTEDDIYHSLKASIDNLDQLIKDIKKNPKKYLKISVF